MMSKTMIHYRWRLSFLSFQGERRYLEILKRSALFISLLTFCIIMVRSVAAEPQSTGPDLFQMQLTRIDGSKVSMSSFQGKVILVVNTASRCGFTPQYKDLEVLYERYRERGFVVLGFPSNDFRNQEPGSDEEIAKFCKAKFGVSFPLFKKGSVTGPNMQPFYSALLSQAGDEFREPPSWNFEKFLLSRSGAVVARFGSFVNPLSDRITTAIDRELALPMQTKIR